MRNPRDYLSFGLYKCIWLVNTQTALNRAADYSRRNPVCFLFVKKEARVEQRYAGFVDILHYNNIYHNKVVLTHYFRPVRVFYYLKCYMHIHVPNTRRYS